MQWLVLDTHLVVSDSTGDAVTPLSITFSHYFVNTLLMAMNEQFIPVCRQFIIVEYYLKINDYFSFQSCFAIELVMKVLKDTIMQSIVLAFQIKICFKVQSIEQVQ